MKAVPPEKLAVREPLPPDPLQLQDNFGRPINYVRLSVTDKCNLRCLYCMPEKMRFAPSNQLLGFDEMHRLLSLLGGMGVNKVRITGGEPFIREGLLPFLRDLRLIPGIGQIHITTNGVTTGRYIQQLREIGIAGINLSLDTLDARRFADLTRRDQFHQVWACLENILQAGIPLKLNAVIMEEWNTQDILPMAELTRDRALDVRYIEEMPFNGTLNMRTALQWNHQRILHTLKEAYPSLEALPAPDYSTAAIYRIPGYRGTVGIIAGFSRTFCGTCNRIRVTAQGQLQTCLYGKSVLDIRRLLRDGSSDNDIRDAIRACVNRRFRDGWEAQQAGGKQEARSMSIIGG